MERLGLWGDGLPYRKFESFMNSINQRGLGAAEMIAMELKAAGVYVCRGLSYHDTEVITRSYSYVLYIWDCTYIMYCHC